MFSHLLTDMSPVPMLEEIGSTEALCALCEHDITVVLDKMRMCINSSHSQKNRFSIHQNELKQWNANSEYEANLQ